MELIVSAIEQIARGIRNVELSDVAGRELPPFTAGAHVDLRLGPASPLRYSLCNAPAQRTRYVIIAEDGDSAYGGSTELLAQIRVGSTLHCCPPQSTFSLVERATSFLFIAEGMGIAPIMSMLRHVGVTGDRAFRLYYSTFDAASTPFGDELASAELRDRVIVHHHHGDPDRALDLWPILERPTGDHLYGCGRRPMLESIRDMSGHWPASRVHLEMVGSAEKAQRADDRPFRVRLARSGGAVDIAADQTILEALRSAGHDVPSSCESGTCGTCRTRLLEGIADHRDLVLGDDEQDDYIMVCVSRARSAELTIDR